MAILADTGPLYAAIDRADSEHERCVAALARIREPIIVPFPVIVEVCRLIQRRLQAEHQSRFLRSLTMGELEVEHLGDPDILRAADLVERYADARFGFVDASVVALAERFSVTRLLTLDRRDFSLVRPTHCPSFEFIP